MKLNRFFFFVFILTAACAASAQSSANPPAKTTKPATTTARTGTTATHAAAATANKLPPGVPVVRGIVKSAPFTLRYQDIAIGTGAVAEPNKMYKVNYTGYLGVNGRPDDGHKFDSSFDHRAPVMGKDGKPVMGDDGKPKLGDAQPMAFPQGFGRLIPGFDQGFEGMKVGGKRRLFIPWQLAYGATGRPPTIPAKSNLIFDVELVDVADLPAPPPQAPVPARPPRPFQSAPAQPGSGAVAHPATPGTPATTTAPATPNAPATPPPASVPATPAPSAQPAAPAAPPQAK